MQGTTGNGPRQKPCIAQLSILERQFRPLVKYVNMSVFKYYVTITVELLFLCWFRFVMVILLQYLDCSF